MTTKIWPFVQHLGGNADTFLATAQADGVKWMETDVLHLEAVKQRGGTNILRVDVGLASGDVPGMVDRVRAAQRQYGTLVDVYETWNEPPCNGAQMAALNTATIQVVETLRCPLLVGCISVGNPQNLADWAAFVPALRAAMTYGGGLALHEYHAPQMQSDGWTTLRYRKMWALLPPDVQAILLWITECGIDGGTLTPPRTASGWQDFTDAAGYLAEPNLQWYDQEIGQDNGNGRPHVVCATPFTCGYYPPWQTFDYADALNIARYITANRKGPQRMPHTDYDSPNHAGPLVQMRGWVIHSTRSGQPITLQREFDSTADYFRNPAPTNPATGQPDPNLAVSAHATTGPNVNGQRQIDRPVHRDVQAWHARFYNETHRGVEIVQPHHGDALDPEAVDSAAYVIAEDWVADQKAGVHWPLQWDVANGLAEHWEIPPGIADGKSDIESPFDRGAFLRRVQFYVAQMQGVPMTDQQKAAILDHLNILWGYTTAATIKADPAESEKACHERIVALKQVLGLA